MRSILSFTLVLLACASLSSTNSYAGKPSGGGGGGSKSGLTLVSAIVLPTPGELTDFATMSITTRRGEICFSTTVNQLTGYITSIGIYRGAPNEIGPMVVRLSPSPIGIDQLNGCVAVNDASLLSDISRNPSAYFVQINTNLHPGGDLRAQLR
jgi:hypothetical protein